MRSSWHRSFFFFVLGLFLFSPILRAQNLITVAGGGTPSPTPGNYGDGGPATLATINGPDGLAYDSQGNLYIADPINVVVRKVSAAGGTISTVAGMVATPGYTGDGGPATLATLYYPFGLTFDPQDNLYIADFYNNVVRKVSASNGQISTVVGVNPGGGYSGDNGPATLAQLNNPQDVKFDSQGNLYVSDSGNHVVRKVSAGTSIITTYAGTGSAGSGGDGGPATQATFKTPEGLAFDAAGNLYIADDGSFVIRKVAAGTHVISTVAGNGSSGFSGDNGPATQASFSTEVDGIAVGCGGNLYIADELNHRVRMVSNASGTITTVIGTGTPGYSNGAPASSSPINGPDALIFNSQGDLILANYTAGGVGTVQKVVAYCTVTPTPTITATPTRTPSPAPTAIGCGAPIETYCFPNPVTGGTATILCNLCEAGQVTITLYNAAAELVETLNFSGVLGANNYPLNAANLSHGIYYYIVRSQGALGTSKSNPSKFAVVR